MCLTGKQRAVPACIALHGPPGGGQQRGVGRSRQRRGTSQKDRTQRSSQHVSTSKDKMNAAIGEGFTGESSAEQKLWKQRGVLEQKIVKKERMIHNAQERLRQMNWVWKDDRSKLEGDVSKIRNEIDEIREEITAVDDEIRAGEEDEWRKAGEEEAAKELDSALDEARRKVVELEGKLREAGRI